MVMTFIYIRYTEIEGTYCISLKKFQILSWVVKENKEAYSFRTNM